MKILTHLITVVLLATLALVVATKTAMAQDPVKVAPDIFKVLLENERVRVLEARLKPGEKVVMHSHPATFAYFLSTFNAKSTLPDGKTIVREIKAGETAWREEITHAEENVGTTDVHVLLIEIKSPQISATDNKAVLRRAIENFNNPENRTAYLDLYDANIVLHGYGLAPGIESIKQFYNGFWSAFPDGHLTIDDLIAEGDKVGCRFTFHATHQGDIMGVPPTGRQVTITGITILRFAGGKCVERWSNADFFGMMQQLNVTLPPQGQPGMAMSQDPVKVAPHVYKVLFENDQVRALDIRMKPGEKSEMHSHPAHLAYVLNGGKGKLTTADGQAVEAEFMPGQVIWSEPTAHAVENVGSTEVHALGVELKASAKMPQMSPEQNKAIPRRFIEEVFNKGKLTATDEMLAANYIDHDPAIPPGLPAGPEGVKQAITMYRAAFPDIHVTVEGQLTEGDKVVTRWTARGTHKGTLMDTAPTGKQIVVTGMTIERINGNKIAESWVNWDTLGMMQQLGLVPMPGQAGK